MITPNFQIKTEKETQFQGVFIIEPLPQGYGNTLGTALRRVLLSSLPGAAIVQAKINGVRHLFSTLKGLKEDIVELTLNLKRVRIAYRGDKPVKITLDKKGPGIVTAGDFETPAGVEIVNKDLVLGHLADENSYLKGEFIVEAGYGYVPAEARETEKEIGVIPLDAIFSPVIRVNYHVGATRVGRMTNFDKLTLEIITDGTISPKEALIESAQTLKAFLEQIINPQEIVTVEPASKTAPSDQLKISLEELELPTRIINALTKEGYNTIEDLKTAGAKKIAKVKNLGVKSLKIIEKTLAEKGITLE